MSLLWASGMLVVALPFLLWPLLRHQEALPDGVEVERRRQEALRQSALLAIEEILLDEASGRLDGPEARRRLAEARSNAERVLRRP